MRLYFVVGLYFCDWTSSLYGRPLAMLYDACTIMPRHLKGLESLAVSLGRADAAADLSWIESILATSTRGKGAHGQGRAPEWPQPLEPPGEVGEPDLGRNSDASESPSKCASRSVEEERGGTGQEYEEGRSVSDEQVEETGNGSSGGAKAGVADSNAPGSASPSTKPPDPALCKEALEAVPAAVAMTEGIEIPTSSEPASTTESFKPPECAATEGFTLAVDARLVPACATLSVGAFNLVCSDDRAGRNVDGEYGPSTEGLSSAGGLGKIEIFGGASNAAKVWGMGEVESFTDAAATNTGATKADDPSSENQVLFVSWETLTTTTEERRPSVHEGTGLGFAKIKLARFFRNCFARHSARCLVPMGGRASMRLGEVRVQCHPVEAPVGKDVSEQSPPSVSCVVVRKFSAIPTIVAETQKQAENNGVSIQSTGKEQSQRRQGWPSARHALSGAGGAVETSGGDFSGDAGTRRERCLGGRDDGASAAVLRRRGLVAIVQPTPQQLPPPLPPRASPKEPPAGRLQRFIIAFWGKFRRDPGQVRREYPRVGSDPPPGLATFRIPDVKIHASTVTGGVDAGLAGWLNLRGLREAEEIATTQHRIAKLVAAGITCSWVRSITWLRSAVPLLLAPSFLGTLCLSVRRQPSAGVPSLGLPVLCFKLVSTLRFLPSFSDAMLTVSNFTRTNMVAFAFFSCLILPITCSSTTCTKGGMPPSRDASFGPRKLMSIDKVRVSVEEVQGSGAPGVSGHNVQGSGDWKRRGGGRFDFEADDVSVKQVRREGYCCFDARAASRK